MRINGLQRYFGLQILTSVVSIFAFDHEGVGDLLLLGEAVASHGAHLVGSVLQCLFHDIGVNAPKAGEERGCRFRLGIHPASSLVELLIEDLQHVVSGLRIFLRCEIIAFVAGQILAVGQHLRSGLALRDGEEGTHATQASTLLLTRAARPSAAER